MSEHHPSCRPSDRNLVWHCSQCGLIELAECPSGARCQFRNSPGLLNWLFSRPRRGDGDGVARGRVQKVLHHET